mgnify:CR=1 FL=1
MKKILIVEDEKTIVNELKEILVHDGYEVLVLTDFDNSMTEISKSGADLILMDINIPNINGESLLKNIRKESNVPVIMLTSKSSEIDEVLSMSYGADDYITKPYNPTILLLRIQNIFKRLEQTCDTINYLDLTIYLSKSILKKDDIVIDLTKNEMIIFSYLLNNKDRIVTRDELMTILWDNEEYINDNALTVNISRLRRKLSSFGYGDIIETRKNQGYILK